MEAVEGRHIRAIFTQAAVGQSLLDPNFLAPTPIARLSSACLPAGRLSHPCVASLSTARLLLTCPLPTCQPRCPPVCHQLLKQHQIGTPCSSSAVFALPQYAPSGPHGGRLAACRRPAARPCARRPSGADPPSAPAGRLLPTARRPPATRPPPRLPAGPPARPSPATWPPAPPTKISTKISGTSAPLNFPLI